MKFQPIEADIQFADELLKSTRAEVLEEILAKHKELQSSTSKEDILDIKNLNTENEKVDLRIFVSKSMQLAALKHYYIDAAKYGATLVFKGLPNGSFKEILNLVAQLEQESLGQEVNLIIDDEEFDRFGVRSVPAVVLSKISGNCIGLESCPIVFDKVIGNIGITNALTLFAAEGDLSTFAQNILAK
ncbi:MAG: type-F conjugative transfer system pilin assembly protein TrbC [Sphingobacteriaceae bacterium]|nr:MAG: type-F conjugative transfer system pilin assembly protein TrbC [Sphingobacteriaceae bacterium]